MDEQPALANNPSGMRRAASLRRAIRKFAREHLPTAMVPSQIVIVDELPKLPNGKVDRAALSRFGSPADLGPEPSGQVNPTEAAVCALWADLLGREQVDAEADFFALGGTSLTVLRMMAQWLADGGPPFDLGQFLALPTARHLARLTGGAGPPGATGHPGISLPDAETLSATAVLPPDVQVASPSRQAQSPHDHILVTESEGRLGPFIIRELLDHSSATVHVLIRALDTESAMQRISKVLRSFNLWRPDYAERLVPVLGDISRPYLGIEPEVYRALSRIIGMIVHQGECFDYRARFDHLQPVNILGTQEVLRLAAAEIVKPVHFVSLIGIADRPPAHVAGALRQSKWVGEQYMRQAAERGIPTRTYRLGHLITPRGDAVKLGDEFLSAMIDYCIACRSAPDLDLSFSVTPAELFADAVAKDALSGRLQGGSYAVVAGSPVHWRELISGVRAAGRVLNIVPYRSWRRMLLETVEKAEVHRLTPFIPLVEPDGLSPALGYSHGATGAPERGREAGRTLLQSYAARLDSVNSRHSGTVLREHTITVPLDHTSPGGPTIEVFAQEIVSAEREHDELPWMLFLNGGPGAPTPRLTAASGWLSTALRGHRVLVLDQRGGGRSTPITARSIGGRTAGEMAAFLRHFRADSIVADAEILRAQVAGGRRWSILGQSYGGFIALTYLSMAPEGLRSAFVSGGLPGLDATADQIYAVNYAEIERKNASYYSEYPEDAQKVRQLADYLDRHEVRLADGDRLTSRRLRLLGRDFGMSDGFERVHRLFADAWDGSGVSNAFRRAVIAQTGFIDMPLYALQEFIYAHAGYSTRWAAHRALAAFPAFDADAFPLLLFGEMIFPWMFREIAHLRPFAEVADLLASSEDFPDLYDPARLASNKVPLVALVYPGDPYTPEDLQRRTAEVVANTRLVVSPEFHHNGLMRNGELLARLLEMVEEGEQ
jgi:thioester reductase-like protein